MTKKEIYLFLEKEAKFTFAKTMANIPHSWICRKDYEGAKFLKVMSFINDNGYSEKFYAKEYVYYNINKYKYWVMTDSAGFNDSSAIINRAKL
ncbi:hypothetical protein N9596_07510 [Flavobacteriaceae bacterium]|jgi:hypothetical protein|nr:hypothetical protein [Flavobacteriaceae bacterium]